MFELPKNGIIVSDCILEKLKKTKFWYDLDRYKEFNLEKVDVDGLKEEGFYCDKIGNVNVFTFVKVIVFKEGNVYTATEFNLKRKVYFDIIDRWTGYYIDEQGHSHFVVKGLSSEKDAEKIVDETIAYILKSRIK